VAARVRSIWEMETEWVFHGLGTVLGSTALIHRLSSPDMTYEETNIFRTTFSSLDKLIDKTRRLLITPDHIANPTTAMIRTLVVAHSLVHAATMQLYNPFAQENDHAKNKSLSAARAVLQIIGSLNIRDFTYINPIMGVSLSLRSYNAVD
jgi:hypothetical protein